MTRLGLKAASSARIGRVQRRLLDALRRYGREVSLQALAAFAEGSITDLDARAPYPLSFRRATYVSVVRAVAGLRRRGLVHTETAGTARGRVEGLQTRGGGRLVWRFRHPGWRVMVRANVDSLGAKT